MTEFSRGSSGCWDRIANSGGLTNVFAQFWRPKVRDSMVGL